MSQHSSAVRDHGAASDQAVAARRVWRAEWWIGLFIALADEPTPVFTDDQRRRFAEAVAHIPILQEVNRP